MRQLTILVVAVNAVGHVNACAGALCAVRARGHRVVFVVDRAFRGKLTALGYEEWIVGDGGPHERPTENNQTGEPVKAGDSSHPGESNAANLLAHNVIGAYSPLQKMTNLFAAWSAPDRVEAFRRFDRAVRDAIDALSPDLIYVDTIRLPPSVYYSGIAWVRQVSTNPVLFYPHSALPPGGSGLPTNDRTDWPRFDSIGARFKCCPETGDQLERWGYERFPNDALMPETQLFTVYAFPDELDYAPIRRLRWFNLQVFDRRCCPSPSPQSTTSKPSLTGLVPDRFVADDLGGRFTGKWVYVSLGSMGSVDLTLMRRLVTALGRTEHKYIVSKGPLHDRFCLPANMWGARHVPQTAVVAVCDLVVSHGGNNTVTEVLAAGKPLLVVPQFADQFDNAQRLVETGLGAALDPNAFTDQQLVDSVTRLLHDRSLHRRLRAVARRIRGTDQHRRLAAHIECLFA